MDSHGIGRGRRTALAVLGRTVGGSMVAGGVVLACLGPAGHSAAHSAAPAAWRAQADLRPAAANGPTVNGDPADWLRFTDGTLVYGHDQQGNTIPDFSYAGYANGDRPLPTVKAATTLGPNPSGDDTDRIQQALDQVAARPLGPDGFRGAVELKAGTYRIGKPLTLNASGVVLRGAGSGADGTRLIADGTPRALITLGGTGTPKRTGGAHAVTDDYVPVGATTVTLDSTAGLKVGQDIIVQRPQEQSWIAAIGMDHLPPHQDGSPTPPWTPNQGLLFQRTVTAIDGNRVSFAIPLTNALEKQYTHATVWAYEFPDRISDVGVEGLSADGTAFTQAAGYDKGGFLQAGFARIDAVRDGWLRDITASRFGWGMLSVGANASRITVTHTQALAMEQAIPQAPHIAQPGAYSIDGQQVLVTDCKVVGSNLHAWLTGGQVPGPNVFSRCTSVKAGDRRLDAGPHQRWATGTLYDALTMEGAAGPEDDLALVNRGNTASGQGWAGANQVAWNAKVGYYGIENPPTAHNWSFGMRGTVVAGEDGGEQVSTGRAVTPESLYAEQLAERAHTPVGQPPSPTGTPTPPATTDTAPTPGSTAAPGASPSGAPASGAPVSAAPDPLAETGGRTLGPAAAAGAGLVASGAALVYVSRSRRRRRS
ncbi:hypothetical protein [Kitasatospora sp. NPDC093102]|uniref:hypothetical protein n=1 Tax=Kitasatospora sp. NPDC093102 TaxID=3155069 RepID=UPI00341AC5D0